MNLVASIAVLFSVLVPTQMWFGAAQPVNVTVKSDAKVALVLTEFDGRVVDPKVSNVVEPGAGVDLRKIYPILGLPGTHILYAVPEGKELNQFVGTPLLINSRGDTRPGAPADASVIRVEPLRYAVLETEQGNITLAFYYDVAPNTVSSFLRLSEEGFYDGLTFHRIIPDFVVQGGDPRGDGTGGPGFTVNAEFNNRKHEEGVLSMARNGDPLEPNQRPRPEFANSAGSQFYICLSTKPHLDGRYTAFGKVTAGMEAVKAIAGVPIADPRTGRPKEPPVIRKITVKPVTAAENPYVNLLQSKQEQ